MKDVLLFIYKFEGGHETCAAVLWSLDALNPPRWSRHRSSLASCAVSRRASDIAAAIAWNGFVPNIDGPSRGLMHGDGVGP
jgi:hypothetical protein